MFTCWNCGKKITIITKVDNDLPIPNNGVMYRRCYCKDCQERIQIEEEEERQQYIKLKKREMVRKALNILEDQNTNMYAYKEAIDVVREHVEKHPDKFDSSYEVLAAIVLVQNRIYSKMQYKIGKYQVDFLLPELCVVLEIDGERHKYHKGHDSTRDKYINQQLGPGWDVIRIKTENLDTNAKELPKAIKRIIDYRQTGIFKS
jgi:very-short-patch-repair endonuclease